MEVNYKDTINLPKTEFSMKARLAQLEPALQKKWEEMDLYGKVREARKGCEKYILHDGPPYPTGDIHIGTGRNKILKDFLVRYRTMQGFDAPYVPGWDCHGLPIELQVLQELGDRREETPRSEVRRLCRRHALKYVEVQKAQFKSLGVGGDWNHPYLTLDPAYEAGILEVFAEMVGKGFVSRDLKPIHWCYHCLTALAEAELEYEDIAGASVYVNFILRDDAASHFPVRHDDEVNLLIWTTTPWTLPGNLAVALHPLAAYAAVRYVHPATGTQTVSILADAAVERVMAAVGVEDFERLGQAKGKDLEGLCYRHPLMEKICPVVLADYVTLDEGTGCVHTAPGHGREDHQTGLQYGLEILSPVDEKGYFTAEAGIFAGQHIVEGDRNIPAHLIESGRMLHQDETLHSYPHCWRCQNPVIFRATDQWFVQVDRNGLRQMALEAIRKTKWIPRWGEERMSTMVSERPDWCISRQRAWGVPIPAFYCERCGTVLLTRDVVRHVQSIFAERGADCWFDEEMDDSAFVPEGTTCEQCGAADWQREKDIFDVWFESGSSHNSVCRHREELRHPADLYLEGVDQYRGWFQLSLLPSLAAWGQAPFRTVMVHEFVVDEKGRKMSKSHGNFVSVREAVERFHAEILRLWASSVDYTCQTPFNADYVEQNMVDAYRRVRNTFRFLLGNTGDFDPSVHAVAYEELSELDRWALDETARLVEDVTRAFDSCALHRIHSRIHNFCTVEMSAVYLDALKDRLYCAAPHWPERRGAQTVLREILLVLCRLCAPILVHTAEEVWSHIAHRDEQTESVHLCHWPEAPHEWIDDELHSRWQRILAVRSDVARAVEDLREQGAVAKGMECAVKLWSADAELGELLRARKELLTELLIVSELEVLEQEPAPQQAATMLKGEKAPDLLVAVSPSPHAKCARCWSLRPSVGKHADFPDLCERCARAVQDIS